MQIIFVAFLKIGRFTTIKIYKCSNKKFGIKNTEKYYQQIENECEGFYFTKVTITDLFLYCLEYKKNYETVFQIKL